MKNRIERYISFFTYTFIFCTLISFVLICNESPFIAIINAIISVLIIIGVLQYRAKMDKLLSSYASHKAQTLNTAIKDSFKTFPVSIAVIRRADCKIQWINDEFATNFDVSDDFLNTPIDQSFTDFTLEKIKNYYVNFPAEFTINDKIYRVFAKAEDKTKEFINFYFIDVTLDVKTRVAYDKTRTIVSLISIDNYEELLRNSTDAENSQILASINSKINEWTSSSGGFIRKFDRDRYLFILSSDKIKEYTEAKFPILESIREIQTAEGISATLSIGIGSNGESLAETFDFALNSLDMALSRGGDQVVIKDKNTLEFFGGVSQEFEKRTKVKSRVIAGALNQIIEDSSNVFIMGHKVSDFDAVGAAIGMAAAIRAKDKPFKIVIDLNDTSATPLIEKLAKNEAYQDIFISPEDALIALEPTTLLIIVDTNRPSYVESLQVLEAASKVVVIDHHRRAADYIENYAVSMHEPYASSTCEIVTELLQYMLTTTKITKTEAEALFSGIMLDTKNFSAKTGSRTFEAAAYLRRIGADVENVKALFKNDFDTHITKNHIISTAKLFNDKFIIATTPQQIDRALASSCADEMLNICNIQATFVIFKNENSVVITARSNAKINVQTLMEKLGGGGSINAAACVFEGETTESVERILKETIDNLNSNDEN